MIIPRCSAIHYSLFRHCSIMTRAQLNDNNTKLQKMGQNFISLRHRMTSSSRLLVAGLGVGRVFVIHKIVEALVELRGKLLCRFRAIVRLLRLGGISVQFLKTNEVMEKRSC